MALTFHATQTATSEKVKNHENQTILRPHAPYSTPKGILVHDGSTDDEDARGRDASSSSSLNFLGTTTQVGSHSQEWSLTLSKQASLGDEFMGLAGAIDDYNVEASKQEIDLIEKEGNRLKEVREVAERLQAESEKETKQSSRSMQKFKEGLQSFCDTTLHYSSIVDTMVQHSPEWTALAWGAIKFLLLVPVEYLRTKENLAVTLGELGAKFRIVEAFVECSPDSEIIRAASVMYSGFAEFLEKSVRWLGASRFKKIFKTAFEPYDKSIKPSVDKITRGYTALREQISAHSDLRTFETNLVSRRMAQEIAVMSDRQQRQEERQKRMDQTLDRLLLGAGLVASRQVKVAPTSRSKRIKQPPQNKQGFGGKTRDFPELLNAGQTFLDDFEPLANGLEAMRHRLAINPVYQQREGLDVINRIDFKKWIRMQSSGLLCINGFELPGRPNWLGDFALRVTQASLLAGYETLYSFNSAELDGPALSTPLALIQRFSGHLINRYPEIFEKGDPDLLSPEIFLAAKTDIELSWKIFVECIKTAKIDVLYLTIERVDVFRESNDGPDALPWLLEQLAQLISPGVLGGKLVKAILTSVSPNAGMEALFGEVLNNQGLRGPGNLLIRVSPLAARSRKQGPAWARRRRPGITLHSKAFDVVDSEEKEEEEDSSGSE